MKNSIVVFGSFVADLTARGPRLPVKGETVLGSSFQIGPGGKGFNQAVAAHKAGGKVTMVTKIGTDVFSSLATETMRALGMEERYVFRTDTVNTGTAVITVSEETGQNQIMIIPGACATITKGEVLSLSPVLESAGMLVTQLETNWDATQYAISLSKQCGAKVLLNPAPARDLSDQIYSMLDLITPNEAETEALSGIRVGNKDSAAKAAEFFLKKGTSQVIITLGERGCFIHDGIRCGILPAKRVTVTDTTGAGDAFNGGLATALMEGATLWEAAEFATRLAALSVQRLGTTPSMPTRAEIDAFHLKSI